ncbi:MAG: hypothetical protein ACPHK8_03155, partial [Thermoplasmatota archaeon]
MWALITSLPALAATTWMFLDVGFN